MKQIIIFCLTFCLFACAVVGNKLGKAVDRTMGNKNGKYEEKYTLEGLDIDILIMTAILTRKNKPEEHDKRACQEPDTYQICSAIKGCWCEKSHSTEYLESE